MRQCSVTKSGNSLEQQQSGRRMTYGGLLESAGGFHIVAQEVLISSEGDPHIRGTIYVQML